VHNKVRKNRSAGSKVEMGYTHTHTHTHIHRWWYKNINIITWW